MPTRRAILDRLRYLEQPVKQLAEPFEMSLPAISQYLQILCNAGLVSQQKSGRQRLYRLNPAPLPQVSQWVAHYEPFWQQKLDALGAYLEENSGFRLSGFTVTIQCEVVELEEPNRLVYTWQESPTTEPSLVIWTLTPVAGGTQLHLKYYVILTHYKISIASLFRTQHKGGPYAQDGIAFEKL